MKVVFAFVFLLLAGGAQYSAAQVPTPSPQKEPEVTYKEILDKLRNASERDTVANTSRELADAVRRRGIWYVLQGDDRKSLKAAGASDELLATIDNALPDAEKKRIEDITRLYQVLVDNYSRRDGSSQRRFVETSKEFLTKYGNEPRIKEQVEWVRYALPRIEKYLKMLSENS